jgi:hypothetical protein
VLYIFISTRHLARRESLKSTICCCINLYFVVGTWDAQTIRVPVTVLVCMHDIAFSTAAYRHRTPSFLPAVAAQSTSSLRTVVTCIGYRMHLMYFMSLLRTAGRYRSSHVEVELSPGSRIDAKTSERNKSNGAQVAISEISICVVCIRGIIMS